MPNKNRFTQENSTTMVAKPEIVPLMTAREAALNRSRDMVNSKIPFDNYFKANDFGPFAKAKSYLGSKTFDILSSNCTLSATNCYGDPNTLGTARTIVMNDPKSNFKEIPVDSIQPGDLVIQSLPNVPDGINNSYHTMIFDGYAPKTYINQEGDLVKKGEMEFNYSKGEKWKGNFVRRPKSVTDENNGKTHYRYYRLVPENKLGNKIRFHQNGGGLTTGNEYADLALSFMPIVGSVMDISNAIANPSFKNISTAVVSTGLDLLGGSLIKGALKSARLASKATQLSEKLPKVKQALDVAKRNLEINPTKGNRATVRRRFKEYKDTLSELNEVAPKHSRFKPRRVPERKMPENWSKVINPYTVYGTDAIINAITQFN